MGKVEDIYRCIGCCCVWFLCDIVYLLNDKCFVVQCFDGVLCQISVDFVLLGVNVKLVYMNRGVFGQKEKGKCEVVVIIFLGGMVVWGVKIVLFFILLDFQILEFN